MSNQHSIIEHRANYFFLKIEEDYIAIFPKEDKHRHCKAAILSIIEHWMNSKRAENEQCPDMYVYLSYPQFAKQMFELFGRSTVIRCMKELVVDGLVLSHPYVDAFNQKTFAYMLNVEAVNALLCALPKRKGSVKVNGGSVKVNDPGSKVNDPSFKNELPSFKSKRNIDYIDTNIDSPQTHKEEGEVATSAEDRTAPAAENITDYTVWKRKTDPRMPAMPKGKTDDHSTHSSTELPHSEPGNTDTAGMESAGTAEHARLEHTTPTHGASTPAQRSDSPPGTLESHGAGQDDKPPLALTARQIKAQAERREKELWAIIEAERNTKYTETQRRLYENKEGMKCLIADDISDEALRDGLKALDAFQNKSFTVLKFYGWMPNLNAKMPILLKKASNGHHSDMVEWQGHYMTVEQADELGYNGGFGAYK